MSWGERSFFFQGAWSKDPPTGEGGGQLLMSLIYKAGLYYAVWSLFYQANRFEHLFSNINIMTWFG